LHLNNKSYSLLQVRFYYIINDGIIFNPVTVTAQVENAAKHDDDSNCPVQSRSDKSQNEEQSESNDTESETDWYNALNEETRLLLLLEFTTMGSDWLKAFKSELTKPYFLSVSAINASCTLFQRVLNFWTL
jgi:hypothetical protein